MAAPGIFLQMLPCGFYSQRQRYTRSPRRLHLFSCKNHGTFGYGVFCATKEAKSDHISAYVSPYCHAYDFLGLHQVLPRRSWNICWYVHIFLVLFNMHNLMYLLTGEGEGTGTRQKMREFKNIHKKTRTVYVRF